MSKLSEIDYIDDDDLTMKFNKEGGLEAIKNRLSLQHKDETMTMDDDRRSLLASKLGLMDPKEHDRRKRIEQIKVYLITYISYALIHFQREFWSLSKPYITKQHPDELSKAVLSRFDTA